MKGWVNRKSTVANTPKARTMRIVRTGFTLIELLVAMAIFAMLAVAGWQIMDSITKSRDRANSQLTQLSQLQYAYLQLSQDFAQVTNTVNVPPGINSSSTQQTPRQASLGSISPTFKLTATQVDLMRLADPDPRVNPPPTLARVVYRIDNGKLIKQRFYQRNDVNEQPSSSVILTGIKEAKWIALTPEAVDNFPDTQTLQKLQQQPLTTPVVTNPVNNNTNDNSQNANNQPLDLSPYQQLPKGVELSFTYDNKAIVWRFALPAQAPSAVIQTKSATSSAQNGAASGVNSGSSGFNHGSSHGATNELNNSSSNTQPDTTNQMNNGLSPSTNNDGVNQPSPTMPVQTERQRGDD